MWIHNDQRKISDTKKVIPLFVRNSIRNDFPIQWTFLYIHTFLICKSINVTYVSKVWFYVSLNMSISYAHSKNTEHQSARSQMLDGNSFTMSTNMTWLWLRVWTSVERNKKNMLRASNYCHYVIVGWTSEVNVTPLSRYTCWFRLDGW